jgi:hypothetical protein
MQLNQLRPAEFQANADFTVLPGWPWHRRDSGWRLRGRGCSEREYEATGQGEP